MMTTMKERERVSSAVRSYYYLQYNSISRHLSGRKILIFDRDPSEEEILSIWCMMGSRIVPSLLVHFRVRPKYCEFFPMYTPEEFGVSIAPDFWDNRSMYYLDFYKNIITYDLDRTAKILGYKDRSLLYEEEWKEIIEEILDHGKVNAVMRMLEKDEEYVISRVCHFEGIFLPDILLQKRVSYDDIVILDKITARKENVVLLAVEGREPECCIPEALERFVKKFEVVKV